MDRGSEEAKIGYAAIAELMEKLSKETSKLAGYQNKMVEQNLALSRLNKSFDQAQSRLERVATAKCGRELLDL